jgi:hypothetical protein
MSDAVPSGLPVGFGLRKLGVVASVDAPPPVDPEPDLRALYEAIAQEYRYAYGNHDKASMEGLEKIYDKLMILSGKLGISAMSFPQMSTCCGSQKAQKRTTAEETTRMATPPRSACR